MTQVAWAVAAVGLVAAGLLGLILAGAMREIGRLRAAPGAANPDGMARDGRTASGRTVAAGLAPGGPAPAFHASAADGRPFSSADMAGRSYVLLFAHPGCGPCERIVPEAMSMAESEDIPPLVVVSRGGPDAQPPAWQGVGHGHATLVLENGDSVSSLFDTAITPHAFVVDESGRIAAQGIASSGPILRRMAEREGGA